jgi:hypothetical protein
MDWASVVSIAITGAVGISGVAGTILAARITSTSATKDLQLSITAENDRQHKAEKRRLYAVCLATITEYNLASIKYRRTHSRGVAGKLRDAMILALGNASLIASRKLPTSWQESCWSPQIWSAKLIRA